MKQFYLLTAFLLLAAAAFSQQNPELGFVIKAGTFTLPDNKKYGNSGIGKSIQPGASFSFGVFAMKQWGKHFGASAEMLYNFSAYKMRHQYDYRGADGYQFNSNTGKYFDVQSFMFPLKMHFRFKKDGKFSLYTGATPIFLVGSNVQTYYGDNSGYTYAMREKDSVVRKDGSEGIQLFFTAGGQYRIHPNTSIGLEFTGGLKSNNIEQNSFYLDYGGCLVGAEPMYTYWIKSFAISLRHNILR